MRQSTSTSTHPEGIELLGQFHRQEGEATEEVHGTAHEDPTMHEPKANQRTFVFRTVSKRK